MFKEVLDCKNASKNESYVAETLPYPSVHIVFERGNSIVYGVHQKKFSITLSGSGSVFGIKFKPAGFYPFYFNTITKLTNKRIPFNSLFNLTDDIKMEARICRTKDDKTKIELFESWIQNKSLKKDSKIEELNYIINGIKTNSSILSVDQIVKVYSIQLRTLQRLFREYVGVSPKWVIQQYRMQEIAERLEKDKSIHLADFTNEFGFFDQAHFNRVFKKMIGLSPEKYLESLN
ncbi:helix-turn-helix domain-containing protein [Leptospira paudalimensis]|uniref:Helix-turn-helix domain-containing protein n=1 Tax=Leptospira paudalimensis TaxID=2950024 RepID=A0ABT3MAC5_9LEPT|nr:helix-turn-helix domain-containing protein [Leptospira paudalimensis]MCW7505335.1 helix-turn-helix domain-containing protein [Leptospira paudalimensis]